MVVKGFGMTKADQQVEQQVDHCLQQLALTAQQYPHLSPERQQALSQLVNQILASGHIGHPQRGRWSAQVYQDLHREALQKTCLYICQNIENYRPEYPVMAWVNNLLGFKLKEAARDYSRHQEVVLPSQDELDRRFLDQQRSQSNQDKTQQQLLRQFLRDDPEQRLQSEHIRGRPDVTFQYLAIARYIDDQTWASLAEQTGIPIPTLSSFFNRGLRKLKPYFHKHLQD